MCCPHPSASIIQPTGQAGFYRKFLLWVVYGEIVNSVFKAVLFGILSGVFNLVSIWIDYMGYATMHYCQVMIIIFSGLMDIIMAAV